MPLIVNGETIDDSLIREEARQMRPRYQEMVTDMDPIEAEMQLRDWSRENVIERTLLRQEALKDPQPIPDEEIDAALRQVTEQPAGQSACRTEVDPEALRAETETRLRVERLVRQVTGRLSPPRNKEISAYYRKHKDEFWTPELIGARHIVKHIDEPARRSSAGLNEGGAPAGARAGTGDGGVADAQTDEDTARRAIEDAKAKLDAGEEFEKLADGFSDCPGNGGDLGHFPRGEMVPEFEEVVFGMEPGQTSDIFRTTFGYHIARVYDRKPEGVAALDDVREQISALLLKQKQDRALEGFLDRLRAKAEIQHVKEAVPAGGEA